MSAVSSTIVGEHHGARAALLLAGLCVVGLALTWVLADLVPITHEKDAVALYDFTRLNRPFVEAPANALLDLLNTPFFIAWGIVLVAIALRAGLPRVAARPGDHNCRRAAQRRAAEATARPSPRSDRTEIHNQRLMAKRSRDGYHTLVWSALLVAPPSRRRAFAIAGVALAAAVGCSLLILAWHMPSDVLGGYLLATMWAALALALLLSVGPRGSLRVVLRPSDRPARPRAHPEPIAPPLISFAARLRMNSMSESRFR